MGSTILHLAIVALTWRSALQTWRWHPTCKQGVASSGAGLTAPSGNTDRDLVAFDSRLRYEIRQEERVKSEERVKTESLAEREENEVDYSAPGDSGSDVEISIADLKMAP